MADPERPPIFIVGSARSGTSLVRLILDSHPDISCGPETQFLPALERIFTTDWRRLRGYGEDEEAWRHRIAAFFASIHGDYAARRGKARWAEKTPQYAEHLDFVDKLFPECQVIHVLRDPRDVVVSHRLRWGYMRAVWSIQRWRTLVTAARAWGAAAPAGRYMELRYEALVKAPEETLRPVFEFLGEPWDPTVLEYEDHPHDRGPEQRPRAVREQTGEQAQIYTSRVGAARRELDPILRSALWLRNRRLMRTLGY